MSSIRYGSVSPDRNFTKASRSGTLRMNLSEEAKKGILLNVSNRILSFRCARHMAKTRLVLLSYEVGPTRILFDSLVTAFYRCDRHRQVVK